MSTEAVPLGRAFGPSSTKPGRSGSSLTNSRITNKVVAVRIWAEVDDVVEKYLLWHGKQGGPGPPTSP